MQQIHGRILPQGLIIYTVREVRDQDIFAARIDLGNPWSVYIRVPTGVERGVSTLTFANNSGSIVAINGDWGTLYDPVSINISDGDMWNPHFSDPR